MKERTNPEISIYRGGEAILTTLITPQSTRRAKLMEYDEVFLKFTSADSVAILRGDYIDDELFGRFYAKEKQVPRYNSSHGGYDYELTFVRSQYMWDKFKCALVTTLVEEGTLYRKEISWRLTSNIHNHAYQIRQNLLSLGLYLDVKVYIQTELETRLEANLIEYNDVDILSALKLICDTYNCEWWAEEGSSINELKLYFGKCENWAISGTATETEYDDVFIYERGAVYTRNILPVTEGVTAERVNPSRNTSDYFNKLYVYGGTTNVPSNYRKELNFEVSKVSTIDSQEAFKPSKAITYKMVSEVGNLDSSTTGTILQDEGQSKDNIETTTKKLKVEDLNTVMVYKSNQDQIIFSTFNVSSHWVKVLRPTTRNLFSDKGIVTLTLKNIEYYTDEQTAKEVNLYQAKRVIYRLEYSIWKKNGSNYIKIDTIVDEEYKVDRNIYFDKGVLSLNIDIDIPKKAITFEVGEYKVSIDVVLVGLEAYSLGDGVKAGIIIDTTGTSTSTTSNPIYSNLRLDIELHTKEDISFYFRNDNYSPAFLATVDYHNTLYKVLFNPNEKDTEKDSFCFVNVADDGAITYTSKPSGFSKGTHFKMPLESDSVKYGLQYIMIPYGYYTNEYDDSESLFTLGERRLLLPLADNGRKSYLLAESADETKPYTIVEKTIIFDHIYPRFTLKVAEVREIPRSDESTYEDGSTGKTSYNQYAIKLTYIDDSEFPFVARYQQDGTVLGLTFITDSELTDEEKQSDYEISTLAGMKFECNFDGTTDEFIIVRNEEYGAQLPNGVLCPKVGDILILDNWDVRAMAGLGGIEKAEEELKRAGEEYIASGQEENPTFEVVMMSDNIRKYWGMDGIQSGGTSHGEISQMQVSTKTILGDIARVKQGNGFVQSRILSFEYKLDIPYDSPQYLIGDTDRYSRLKQIENGIYRLSHKRNGNGRYGSLVVIEGDKTNRFRFSFKDVAEVSFADLDTKAAMEASADFSGGKTITYNPKFK